jgi:hypothetical protein
MALFQRSTLSLALAWAGAIRMLKDSAVTTADAKFDLAMTRSS